MSCLKRPLERPAQLKLSACALALLLAGCAPLPDTPSSQATLKDISSYQASLSFQASETAWPDTAWWTQYGDAQLNELITEALDASPDMTIAAARVQQAQAMTQVSTSTLLPHVGLSGAITEQRLSNNYLTPAALTPQGWNDYGIAGIDLAWEIDFWGKNRANLAAATSELQAKQADQAQARLMISSSVASSYAELSRLFAAQETAKKAVQVRAKTAELFHERFKNGLENLGGVKQAQAAQADAEQLLLLIDEQIGLQRNQLAALMGAGPDRGLKIQRPNINLNRDFALPKELSANLLGRRPDVVGAKLQAQAQAKRIEQKEAEFYPNVNLLGFLGLQSLGLNVLTQGNSTTGSIGPAIYLPLFTGGRLTGELNSSKAQYNQAVGNYNRTVTKALQDVADTALSKKSLTPRLLKSETALAAATDAFNIARHRYEGNLANYLEVLTAEDAMLGNMRLHTDLQARAFALDIALIRALGGGYRDSIN